MKNVMMLTWLNRMCSKCVPPDLEYFCSLANHRAMRTPVTHVGNIKMVGILASKLDMF